MPKQNQEQPKKTVAYHTGRALAHIQDAFDLAGKWAFSKLRSATKTSQKDMGKVKKAATHVGRFIGEAGQTFYDEYEKLKKERLAAGKKIFTEGKKVIRKGQKTVQSLEKEAMKAEKTLQKTLENTKEKALRSVNSAKKNIDTLSPFNKKGT